MKQPLRCVFGSLYLLAVFAGAVMVGGCDKLPVTAPVVLINADSAGMDSKTLDKCVLSYSILPAGPLEEILRQAADSSVRIWGRHFPKITFQEVGSEENADLVLQMTSPANGAFPVATRDDLLVTASVESQSLIIRRENGSFHVQIRQQGNRPLAGLTGIVAYLFGRALGLAPSDIPGDIMSRYMTTDSHQALSGRDVERLNKLYPDACNGWRVRRKSPVPPYHNPENIYSLPVTFGLPDNDTLYVLWPRAQSAEWGFYKVLLSENPAEDVWTEADGPVIGSPEMSRLPVGLFAVNTENNVYVAPGQKFASQSARTVLYYSPAAGKFLPAGVQFNPGNGIYTGGFSWGNKGLAFTIDQQSAYAAYLTLFGAAPLQLSALPVPFELYTHAVGFLTSDEIPCLYIGHSAYFMTDGNHWSPLVFNHNDPQVFKEPRNTGNEQSFKTWTIGKNAYLIRDNYGWPEADDPGKTPVDLWELDFSVKNASYRFIPRPTQRVEGKVLHAFSHRGTGFLFTSTGHFYQFVP